MPRQSVMTIVLDLVNSCKLYLIRVIIGGSVDVSYKIIYLNNQESLSNQRMRGITMSSINSHQQLLPNKKLNPMPPR